MLMQYRLAASGAIKYIMSEFKDNKVSVSDAWKFVVLVIGFTAHYYVTKHDMEKAINQLKNDLLLEKTVTDMRFERIEAQTIATENKTVEIEKWRYQSEATLVDRPERKRARP